jgi:hypothetical protein
MKQEKAQQTKLLSMVHSKAEFRRLRSAHSPRNNLTPCIERLARRLSKAAAITNNPRQRQTLLTLQYRCYGLLGLGLKQLAIVRKLSLHGVCSKDTLSRFRAASLISLAKNARDEESAQTIVRIASTDSDLSPEYVFAVVRELSQSRFCSHAANLVLKRKSLRTHHQFQQACQRLLEALRGSKVALNLRNAIKESSKGGLLIKPISHPTLSRTYEAMQVSATLSIIQSPSGDPLHIPELKKHYAAILAQLGKPSRSSLIEFRNVAVDVFGQVQSLDGKIIKTYGKQFPQLAQHHSKTIPAGFFMLGATRGIYHWLIDRFPNAELIQPARRHFEREIPMLLSSDSRSFEAETLELFNITSTQILRVDKPIIVERLFIATVPKIALAGCDTSANPWMRLANHCCAIAHSQGVALPKRVYISRSYVRRRRLCNEAHVEKVMADRGFAVYHLEELPLWHQVALFRNASLFVGPHGAGLSHLAFAGQGAKVVELFPAKAVRSIYSLRLCYARLSALRGLEHTLWVEEEDRRSGDWTVNLPAYTSFIDRYLDQR